MWFPCLKKEIEKSNPQEETNGQSRNRWRVTHFQNNAPISDLCVRQRADAIPDAELTDPYKQQHSGSKMVYVSNGEYEIL